MVDEPRVDQPMTCAPVHLDDGNQVWASVQLGALLAAAILMSTIDHVLPRHRGDEGSGGLVHEITGVPRVQLQVFVANTPRPWTGIRILGHPW